MNDRKKQISALLASVLLLVLFALPTAKAADSAIEQYGMLPIYAVDVADGEYTVAVDSDSDAFQGLQATLTVADGRMTAALVPNDTALSELFLGDSQTAAEAEESVVADRAGVFTMPVESLDHAATLSVFDQKEQRWEECTILFRADSLPETALRVEVPDYDLIASALDGYEDDSDTGEERVDTDPVEAVRVDLDDGEYSVAVDLKGGSGKASVATPTILTVKDGKAYARLTWSSSNYDYMVVGDKTYWNTAAEGANSVFDIPIGCWDSPMTVIADTTAMGTPHEVTYQLTFYEASIGGKGQLPQESAKRVVAVAMAIIVGGGVLNHYVKKRRKA
ncbi:MAG: hypothetical protein Q4F79_02815 [Eubacteriales bacterium]|nr:hypothetical protein [Eubacteriales bacterium]